MSSTHKPTGNIEILFGTSWIEGRMGDRIRAEGCGGAGVDLATVMDGVEILVDGANISVAALKDAIFLVLRDLLAGCEDLASGRLERTSVHFYESPWEVSIRREGRAALVSFFRGGLNPRIEVKDRAVDFDCLVSSLVEAGSSLAGGLASLNPQIIADPFVAEILGAIERLRAPVQDRTPSPPVARTRPAEIAREGDPAQPISISWAIRATGRDMLGPIVPNRADLYSLMAEGTLAIQARGDTIAEAEGRPYFTIENLLMVVRHLLGCVEERRNVEIGIEGDDLAIEMRYDATSDTVALVLRGVRDAAGRPATLRALPAIALVDAVLESARDLRRQVIDLNPAQRTNLRFELFADEIDTLGSWRKDIMSSAVVGQEPQPLRREPTHPTIPRAEPGGRHLGARRLMYARKWEAEAEGLRLDATFLCGSRFVVGTSSIVAALDRDSGDRLWQRPGLNGRSIAMMTGESGLLVAEESGEIRMIDLDRGGIAWSTRIAPTPGKPAGVTAGGGRLPRYAVLTTGENGLVAIDLFTGEARWRFRTRRGTPSGFARLGRLLAFTCRSNSVYCLDVDTGDLAWRFSDRSRFDLPPASLGEVVALWSTEQGGRRGRLFALDQMSGDLCWTAATAGRPLTAPVRAGTSIVLVIGSSSGVTLEAWNAATGEPSWRVPLGSPEVRAALLPMDDAVLANTSGGTVLGIQGSTGKLLWERALGTPGREDLPLSLEPVLRDGGLFVPSDTTYVLSPMDGTVLHRIEGDGPVPDLLRVDEQYSIYTAEVSGHVTAYGVVGHLEVVRPGT